MWLQLDGAHAYFSLAVRNYLNRKFSDKCIGRGGLINWPPRSLELTSMDFFFWGYIKNLVYSTSPTTADDMKRMIENAFETVTPKMMHNVKRSLEARITIWSTRWALCQTFIIVFVELVP